jgi:hypothetical protein
MKKEEAEKKEEPKGNSGERKKERKKKKEKEEWAEHEDQRVTNCFQRKSARVTFGPAATAGNIQLTSRQFFTAANCVRHSWLLSLPARRGDGWGKDEMTAQMSEVRSKYC